MYPMKEWTTAKRGYTFLQPTFYGTKHTGLDIMVDKVDYYAPFSGTAMTGNGVEGGTWWQLIRDDGTKFIVRHLSKVLKVGRVEIGQKVAVTGNSGTLTTAPHAHQEVYVNGKLVDPEKFNWINNNGDMFRTYKGTIYALLAGRWVAVSTTYQQFLSDFGGIEAPEMTEDQFRAFLVTRPTIK